MSGNGRCYCSVFSYNCTFSCDVNNEMGLETNSAEQIHTAHTKRAQFSQEWASHTHPHMNFIQIVHNH